eukprot:TRINITY_DN881_c0_g1_i11.p1 TRINITY_DN881_c0_g1~~TRINITY_DN881_c0_g1_i11.p1  ORF type:complete len:112 (+),score=31.38 TRINITY_DN881_c0_g1_i11:243-578(+)
MIMRLILQYRFIMFQICLLYTSDAADDLLCVDLGGRRIIKKKKPYPQISSQKKKEKKKIVFRKSVKIMRFLRKNVMKSQKILRYVKIFQKKNKEFLKYVKNRKLKKLNAKK